MAAATLVYDDDCGFCTWWADVLAARSDLRVVGFSDLDDDPDLRDRLPDDYQRCSHLVTAEAVYSCGASIEEALARSDLGGVARPVVDGLRRIGPYRALREWGYRRVAHNRDLGGKIVSKTPPARTSDDGDRRSDG